MRSEAYRFEGNFDPTVYPGASIFSAIQVYIVSFLAGIHPFLLAPQFLNRFGFEISPLDSIYYGSFFQLGAFTLVALLMLNGTAGVRSRPPLSDKKVELAIESLCARLNIRVPRIVTDNADLSEDPFVAHRRFVPVVYIPMGLRRLIRRDEERFDTILLHELAHIRGKDHIVTVLTRASVIVAASISGGLLLLFLADWGIYVFSSLDGMHTRLSEFLNVAPTVAVRFLGIWIVLYFETRALHREGEFRADAVCVRYGGSLVLKRTKPRRRSLQAFFASWIFGLTSFHPTVEERILSLRKPRKFLLINAANFLRTGFVFGLLLGLILYTFETVSPEDSQLLSKIMDSLTGSVDEVTPLIDQSNTPDELKSHILLLLIALFGGGAVLMIIFVLRVYPLYFLGSISRDKMRAAFQIQNSASMPFFLGSDVGMQIAVALSRDNSNVFDSFAQITLAILLLIVGAANLLTWFYILGLLSKVILLFIFRPWGRQLLLSNSQNPPGAARFVIYALCVGWMLLVGFNHVLYFSFNWGKLPFPFPIDMSDMIQANGGVLFSNPDFPTNGPIGFIFSYIAATLLIRLLTLRFGRSKAVKDISSAWLFWIPPKRTQKGAALRGRFGG